PARLTRPCVGAIATMLEFDAGFRIDTPVSSASASIVRFAATAAAEPPLDPPGMREVSYALLVWPPSGLRPILPLPNASRLDLARMIAPAWRNLATTVASAGGFGLAKGIAEPLDEGISSESIASLATTGMQCSGP